MTRDPASFGAVNQYNLSYSGNLDDSEKYVDCRVDMSNQRSREPENRDARQLRRDETES